MRPRIITKILLTSLALVLTAHSGGAKDLGTLGAVYPVAEPDALKELKSRAARVDWKKVLGREKFARKIANYRPRDLKRLPAAGRNRTFLADLTYTLDTDIADGKGGILYPKGYTFNPLDYVRLRRTIVVIDGDDGRQVAWFRKSRWSRDINAMLLLTGGGYRNVSQKLGRPVFYADRLVVERLKLKAVPSVAVQKGRFMEVREYAVR